MKLFLHCILYSSIVTGLLSAVTTPTPSLTPSVKPTFKPSSKPFSKPSLKPRSKTTNQPTAYPSSLPSSVPTSLPTSMPTSVPTSELGGGTITSVPSSDDFSYSTIPYPTSPPIVVGKVPESGYDTFFFGLSASEITLIIIIATSAFGMLFCGLLIYLVVKMIENAKEIEMLQSQLRETNEAARRDPAAFESSRQNRTTETREREGESFTVVTGVHPNINL